MIKIENLNFSFSGNFTLSIERLEVREGEIFALIGPNGAGKTTLLNLIALLENHRSGKLEIFGKNVQEVKDQLYFRRQIAFVFSQPYLLNTTVYDNVVLPLKLRGCPDRQRVEAMLEFFQLSGLGEVNALKLSQGEKHRVMLARAFAAKPKLVLLDEPFLSLDSEYKKYLMKMLREMIKKDKITAILVTQNMDEVLSLADRAAVMKAGKILEEGNPRKMFDRPVTSGRKYFYEDDYLRRSAVLNSEKCG